MKITVLMLLIVLSCGFIRAQQVLTKRHRFGMSLAGGTNFNSSKSTLLLLESKRSSLFSMGGLYEYQYTGLLAFRVGLNFEFSSASFRDNPSDSTDLYYYTTRPHSLEESPVDYDELIYVNEVYSGTPPEFRKTINRNYTMRYLTLPLEVVFRSKMRNFNRFYAKGGIRTSLLLSSRARENFSYVAYYPDETRNEKIIIRDANRIRESLLFGCGAEHVYTGHSTVYIDFEFDFALTNTYSQQQKDATIFLGHGLTDYYPVANVSGSDAFGLNYLKQSQLRVKIGLLF